MTTVAFGDIIFDRVDFDKDADVLYLSIDGVEADHHQESPEGHVLRFDAEGNLCGVTIIGVSHHVGPGGHLPLTVPKREDLGLDDLVLA